MSSLDPVYYKCLMKILLILKKMECRSRYYLKFILSKIVQIFLYEDQEIPVIEAFKVLNIRRTRQLCRAFASCR